MNTVRSFRYPHGRSPHTLLPIFHDSPRLYHFLLQNTRDFVFRRGLDGLDSYVDCGTAAPLDIRDAITISCWIKVAAFTKNWETILAKGNNSYRMSRSSTTGDSIDFGCNGPTGGNLNASKIVTDNNWHHVACVYDGVNKIIYIDGLEDVRVASPGRIDLSTYPLWIGNNCGSTARRLCGLVDNVRIYSRALSEAEITGLAGVTLPFDKPFQ